MRLDLFMVAFYYIAIPFLAKKENIFCRILSRELSSLRCWFLPTQSLVLPSGVSVEDGATNFTPCGGHQAAELLTSPLVG